MLKHIARVLLGLTFMFSGFVKGIDPWGSAYKFTDYFIAFGMPWFANLAFALGVLLAAAEFIIGTALLFNYLTRVVSWATLVFMVFFTGLTFVLALTNPVTDCGCFAEAIVLTNWETFYKNIVLLALAIYLFAQRKHFERKTKKTVKFALTTATVIAYAILVVYSYRHLPIIDFSAYKIGTNIPEAMKIPEGAAQDVYENTFTYKNLNSGEEKKFTEADYPWQDTLNWKFVKMDDPKLISKGYVPPIHDFRIETPEGDDIKDFFLYDEKHILVLIAPNMNKANTRGMGKAVALAEAARSNGLTFIALTATSPDQFSEIRNNTGAIFEFFNTDEVTLKTIVRSNPGLIVLKKGTIVKKYHFNDIPAPEKLNECLADVADN